MENQIVYISHQRMYYINCPNCGGLCQIPKENIRCGIFRHAVLKSTGKFIDPHTPETECRRLKNSDLVYGCGMPFRFDGNRVEKCGYI